MKYSATLESESELAKSSDELCRLQELFGAEAVRAAEEWMKERFWPTIGATLGSMSISGLSRVDTVFGVRAGRVCVLVLGI